MLRGVIAGLFTLLILSSTAAGGVVERIRVVDAGRPETQVFPPSVFVTVESPSDYAAQAPGTWAGPQFWAYGRPEDRGTSTLEWSVTFRDRTDDVARTAKSAAVNGWPEDQHNGISIPLLAGARQVGTLPGFFVLTANRARFEAGLAVPLGTGVQAVVRFLLGSPSTDISAWGDYLVMGSFLASSWNRGQALIALSKVRVEGNLAPKTVSIRRVLGQRAVRGRVVDAFVNPLVGVTVGLERWAGAAWVGVRTGRTSSAGLYRIAVPGRGRFRTLVTNAGTTVASAPVAVR